MTGRTWLAERIDEARQLPVDTLLNVIVALVVVSVLLFLLWIGALSSRRGRRSRIETTMATGEQPSLLLQRGQRTPGGRHPIVGHLFMGVIVIVVAVVAVLLWRPA